MPEEPTSMPPLPPVPPSPEDAPRQDDHAPEELHTGAEKVMTVLAGAMPWVISLLFHLGLFLIMIFIVFVVLQEETPEEIIIPDALMSETPGGRMTPSEMTSKASKTTQQSQNRQFVRKKTTLAADAGKTTKPVNLIGVGGGGAAAGKRMGLAAAGGGGPQSTFFGTGGNAFNVVYVIDRSGSMVDTFDLVRQEMLNSIGRLRDTQTFHIILFAEGRPIENPPRKLIPATRKNKTAAAKFLVDVTPETQTDPVPALERAFRVLRGAKKRGKLIYLLTDGVFPDNEKVLRTIQAKNTDQNKVYVNTFLYGTKPPAAVDVMTKIANMTGGRYTFVQHEQ
ncbi:MAG: VWA domain-containing protein [Phycisphaerae bacterium]|nr:VWA domain-containing protein [Phycisphaerae bacterium]